MIFTLLILTGCDSDISGTPFENQPPNTELSVRDTSLVDNINEEDRLASTVAASWSGSDPDGFVSAFEVRFYDDDGFLAPEEGWSRTTSTDTLVLLPIPRGERVANVVFEVRAIDNESSIDPTPARTVFPIQNAPPSLRLDSFESPPDTTFTIISFAWEIDDPEGIENIDRVEISLNDSTNFQTLPADISFITLIANVDPNAAPPAEIDAEVLSGRALRSTNITLPGLRLDDDNILYLRAVDLTDTTSALVSYPEDETGTWFVKVPRGRILYVNDYRKNTWPSIQEFHLNLLGEYLPENEEIDTWNLSEPFVSGSGGNVGRSNALPASAEPMLEQSLALYEYIYWVSTNTINNTSGNNLPFAASATNTFFENGGRMMVHSPISPPADPADLLGNPAILLLPVTGVVTFPDTLRQSLRLQSDAAITPVGSLPGVATPLPPLKSPGFIIGTLPYQALGDNVVELYSADYTYLTRQGGTGPWFGSSTVASISADQRVGLFGLPFINEITQAPIIVGADDSAEAPRTTIKLMLESLGFPKR